LTAQFLQISKGNFDESARSYENTGKMGKNVLLWTAPRCISTAFTRSILNLPNIQVFHEPYSNAYYFGPERQSPRYNSSPIDPVETYLHVKCLLCKDYDEIDVVFSKDMAYCIENRFDIFLDDDFEDFKHTFLIRNPSESVPSLYRASTSPETTRWNHFEPHEVGFRQLREFYDFVVDNLDSSPVVVDASDLLDQPDETMKSYCDAVGITYESHMTTWKPGPLKMLDHWPAGWFDTLSASSGFIKRSKKSSHRKSQPIYPDEVKKAIEEATPHYMYLASKKFQPV